MQLEKFPLSDTHAFNSFFLDYIEQKETLKQFYNRYPHPDNFPAQIKDKHSSFPSESRNMLVRVLQKQYESVRSTPLVENNIALLAKKNSFTITTGHQLNIFTGPLYFIFKIITVINTCKVLRERYPEYNFIPVYWMASEDHDYDEIKYFKLYGKKYTWHTKQSGAVGRFSPNGLASLLDEVPGDTKIFREAYEKNKTLSAAVRHYVNALFSDEGLVVIDADQRDLKQAIIPVIEKDIFDGVNKDCVDQTNLALESLGYKTQVYCREINFFYLDEGVRSRIEKSGERFNVVDTDLSFSSEELRDLIRTEPEKFSPNVILRPLFQEIILPNLAYIGGPAEVVYWLQLKQVFENHSVPFPILMPRNFAMIISHDIYRKFEKTGLELKDIFEEKNYLFNHWVLKHSPRNLTVGTERNSVAVLFEELKTRAEQVDKTLSGFVGAQGKRALNSLESIERKLLRAEKRLHADKLRQIEFVKDTLFPNGSLQERADNFLNFYQQDPGFIKKLLQSLDPFDFQFYVFRLSEN
jgi:bacillithiol biosynthesis cysteine-adding enzyme BshC